MATDNSKFARFDNIISSLDAVRRVLREPMHSVVAKQIDHIDDVCKAIIEKSPFVVVASASDRGYPDISPKGDPAGFVRILDEKYLAIPDRPGNCRVDTFKNLLENPYLAVIFMIPGKGETLRVTGERRGMIAHAKLDLTPQQLFEEAEKDGATTLY